MHTVIFTQAARTELIEAQDWYEAESTMLGRSFQHAINLLIEHMSSNPLQFPIVSQNVRRALLRRFPYALFFVIEGETLTVVAFFTVAVIQCAGKSEPKRFLDKVLKMAPCDK